MKRIIVIILLVSLLTTVGCQTTKYTYDSYGRPAETRTNDSSDIFNLLGLLLLNDAINKQHRSQEKFIDALNNLGKR